MQTSVSGSKTIAPFPEATPPPSVESKMRHAMRESVRHKSAHSVKPDYLGVQLTWQEAYRGQSLLLSRSNPKIVGQSESLGLAAISSICTVSAQALAHSKEHTKSSTGTGLSRKKQSSTGLKANDLNHPICGSP